MKKTLFLAIAICLITFNFAMAEDLPPEPVEAAPDAPLVYEFDRATCRVMRSGTIQGRAVSIPVMQSQGIEKATGMVCTTEYPLMTERLASYGKIIAPANRQGVETKQFDFSQDKKLTTSGRNLYTEIMSLKVSRLFAIITAPMGYTTITILPLEQVGFDDALMDQIESAFEKASKLDKALE